jgi:hypothetical protein
LLPSSGASSFATAPIGKFNGHLHLTPIPGSASLIAIRKRDVALTVPGSIVNMYVARLMPFSPYEGKRNRLSLGRKHERLFGVASLNTPAR